ncbi:hypothetical protein RD792_005439 [Penstemon davidsonii]|uniref:Protein kinase domain-containing protein n=1 Tax=Penstemon davidsonii TaxID=160366 RepID=A0ABR0DK89_9LAMI|nr:hypothetical protein RD792_005439 [Penstemon davidsonii]
MSVVLKTFEDISKMNTYTFTAVNQNNKLVFSDDLDHGFDLEELLGFSVEMLRKGTFGTSYKAIFDDEISFVVKRMKDEQLLVYGYYVLGSVSTIIQGESFVYKSALGWEERLRVAVGAARDIAYIHRQDGAKLVHGNIKASNIFLNSQQYGYVTDVGLAMLMSQFRVPDYLAVGFIGYLDSSTISEERTNEVFDIKLLNYENEEAMVQLLQLATRCVVIYPEDRPKMPEVVRILEEISGINTRLEHLLPMLTLHNE